METTSRSARSDDTTGLKKYGLPYVAQALPDLSAVDALALLRITKKAGRGFHHIYFARLLCPLRHLHLFIADPAGYVMCEIKTLPLLTPFSVSTCIQLQAGSLSCTADFMPSYLYPAGQPFDSANLRCGLLRGVLCVKAYQHIFLGRAVAMGEVDGEARQGSQAELIGLERTTPRTIAYAAVQVCSQHIVAYQI